MLCHFLAFSGAFALLSSYDSCGADDEPFVCFLFRGHEDEMFQVSPI